MPSNMKQSAKIMTRERRKPTRKRVNFTLQSGPIHTEGSVGGPPFEEDMRHASLPVEIHLRYTVSCGLDGAASYLHSTATHFRLSHLSREVVQPGATLPRFGVFSLFLSNLIGITTHGDWKASRPSRKLKRAISMHVCVIKGTF